MTAIRAIVADSTAPERLRQLARVVQRLAPDRRRPEAFHQTKSDIEHELRQLAAELERLRR